MSTAVRVAFKRLMAVEVDPDASHQHELHAGALRHELGFGLDKVTGGLRVARFSAQDGATPAFSHGQFTLYDAREAHPERSEWRLYYDIPLFGGASEGDLLVLYRDTASSLTAIVATRDSNTEKQLLRHLALGSRLDLSTLSFIDSPQLASGDIQAMADALIADENAGLDYPAAVSDLIEPVLLDQKLPTTAQMASFAMRAIERVHDETAPDMLLFHGLEAESDIYFELERRLYEPRLARLRDSEADLATVTDFIMSLLQSRRSRRGQSLQHHFASILVRNSVPHSAQCVTETGELPDFIIPSCALYRKSAFPASRLRLVACKTTSRERWRQVLNEAERIRVKYLLTVDTGLTETTLAGMHEASLRVFMPAPIITATYPASATHIGTVQELIDDLKAA